MGKIDNTLFVKHAHNDIVVVQVYVDDIIFGSTNENLCNEFSTKMSSEFEMIMMGELKFFLGLQIKQVENDTFISQSKYCKDMLKKFNFENVKPVETPMTTNLKLSSDEEGNDFNEKFIVE